METGFYYLQSRYYDPALGRFLNADSYASTGQGFLGFNMFAYCGNKPCNCADYRGQDAIVLLDYTRQGHIGALVQDSSGTWYYYYWGTTINLITLAPTLAGFDMPPLEILKEYSGDLSLSSINANCGYSGSFDRFMYIKGDFSDFLVYTNQRSNEAYNLYSNNCSQHTLSLLASCDSHSNRQFSLRYAQDDVLPVAAYGKLQQRPVFTNGGKSFGSANRINMIA